MKNLAINKGHVVLEILVLTFVVILFISSAKAFGGSRICPPDGANVFFQSNGPNSLLKWGDWWTNSDPVAGNEPHMFEIFVPQSVPNAFTLEIELYDPECFQTGTEIDEIEGVGLSEPVWDSAHFWLVAPDGTTEIVNTTYPPAATTSEIWNDFASVSIATYGTGVYKLYSITDVDDQNSFKIKIVEANPDGVPNNGDEINLAPVKSSYQHYTTGFTTFWFFVPVKPELRLANFDMDGAISVVYTDPDDNIINGTVSGGTAWNNNGTSAFPPPGGDVFSNPRSGWWQAKLDIYEQDQYIFYAEGAIFLEVPPAFPDVVITKDDGLTQTVPNYTQTYNITVENIGTGPALNAVVTDTLPTNVAYVSATGNPTVTPFNGTNIVEWDLGQFDPNENISLELTVTVNSETSGNVLNKAFISFNDVLWNDYSGIYDSDNDVIAIPGSIGDLVWHDEDSSGTLNGAETGIDSILVYLKNLAGDKLDSVTTNSNGNYTFSNVIPATYYIDINDNTVPVNYILTTLADPLFVTIGSGENYIDADFGYKEELDSDGDGIPDCIEGPGDRDNDGTPDQEDYDPAGYIYNETTGEILSGGSISVSGPGAILYVEDGTSGYYEFYTDGTPGVYIVTVTPPPGYQFSTTCVPSDPPAFDPTGQANPVVLGHGENGSTGFLTSFDCTTHYLTFDLEPGDPFIINNNYPMQYIGIDFGDALDPTYPTLLANNGARHGILPGYYMGSSVDAESDGQPSPTGLGDDSDGNDDDDGVVFSGALQQSAQNSIDVTVSGNGFLNAWMDLNQDGDWADTGERVIVNEAVTTGLNTVTFNLPAISSLLPLRTVGIMSRFRFSSTPGLSYTGLAADGEVEDYLVDTMVPVELTSFTAESKNGFALLLWQTQTESDNLGFYVYRSDKVAGKYIKVNDEIIKGAGNSESVHEYTFLDNTTETGKTYFYKLGDVSYSGTITMHEAVESSIGMPTEYAMSQNYPNPFNPSTTIEFSIEQDGMVSLEIFNVSGQHVRTLVSEQRKAGLYQVTWDSHNDNGIQVPSGIYLYSINVNGFKQTRRMAFTK
jgi:uncharacterized repeat protein (TIGR01451 family)